MELTWEMQFFKKKKEKEKKKRNSGITLSERIVCLTHLDCGNPEYSVTGRKSEYILYWFLTH